MTEGDAARGDAALAGRVALVTGAGRGIGRAIALRLSAAGAAVAVNDVDPEPAHEVAEEIRAGGGSARACPASVLDVGVAVAMVEGLVAEYGFVDILVNNAGIAGSGKTVLRTPLEELERMLAINAVGPFALCQAVIPSMRARGRGDIVVISSTSVAETPSHGGPYTMAKAALEALARTIAKEEARHGVRAHVVAPGMVSTRLGELVAGRIKQAASATATADAIDLRLEPPETVAETVWSLVSNGRPA